ncbi:MAG: DnaJ domain-containing protein [Halioglobus sp.]
MKPSPDYYQILHVHPQAPREIIKSSYRTLMQRMRMHPDLGGDNDSAAIINEAYAVLMEPEQRAAYDKSRLADAANDNFSGHTAHKATAAQSEPSEARSHQHGNSHEADSQHEECLFCQTSLPPVTANGAGQFCGQCNSPRLVPEQLQDDTEDRRAILRVPKNGTIAFCTHWPQTQAYRGQSQDVSLTGMRFLASVGLEIGQVIKLDAQMLRAVGEVTRLTQKGANWEIGVKFLALHFERTRGSFVADCV